jgi:hypothetical protein
MTVPVQNADAVIRGQLHPRATACYNNGLKTDPTMAGRIVITIVVGPSGEVQSASVAQNSGLSPGVAACIAGGARNLRFPPIPGGGTSTLNAPMTFVHQ